MDADTRRRQAAEGIEQLALLTRAQSWRDDGTPSLPPTQAAIIRMLAALPDGLRAGAIAQRLGVSAASLSDSLKALTEKTWIARVADPADRRASFVRLTRAGRRLAEKLTDPNRGIASLLSALPEQDVGALLRATQLLVREAQRQGLATGPRTCIDCRFFRPFASGRADLPHVCDFVRAPFGDPDLRIDCTEQQRADPAVADANAAAFARRAPSS